MRIFLSLLFFNSFFVSFSQEELSWKQNYSIDYIANSAWGIDAQGSLITSGKGVLTKIDSTGTVKFKQSIIHIGKASEIEPINSMKIIVFCENQQTFCSFDNTLTLTENCLDLANFGVQTVSNIAVSSLSDRIWILDQVNYRLLLMNLQTNYIVETGNLKGMLSLNQIDELKEMNNVFYVFDATKGIYSFDIYGSLMKHYEIKDATKFDAFGENLIVLRNNVLQVIDTETSLSKEYTLPIEGVLDFKMNSQYVYLQTVDKIFCFSINVEN
ncbi:MAG: hypothetical protein V4638_11895 [Bacteroidota bacterium]